MTWFPIDAFPAKGYSATASNTHGVALVGGLIESGNIALTIPPETSKGWRVAGWAVLFAVGLALRIAVGEILVTRGVNRLPDSELYLSYARSIKEGETYHSGDDLAKRTPGYPLLLALMMSVAEPVDRPVGWIQSVFGLGTSVMAGWLASRAAPLNRRTLVAALAAGLTLAEPYGIVLSGMILSETVFTTLFMASITLLVYGWRERGEPWLWLGGLAGSAAALVRPSVLLLAPVAAGAAVILSDKAGRVRSLARCGAAVAGLLLGMAPWWVRNVHHFGQFVATTTNIGESLYDGLHPHATGGSEMSFTGDPAVRSLLERERDAVWRERAIAWARRHPLEVLRLAVIKMGRVWSPWPNDRQFQTPLVTAALTAFTVPLYLLAAVGFWRLASNHVTRPLALLWLVPLLYFTLLHSIFVGSVRYRVPVMPLVAGLAAIGIAVRRPASG